MWFSPRLGVLAAPLMISSLYIQQGEEAQSASKSVINYLSKDRETACLETTACFVITADRKEAASRWRVCETGVAVWWWAEGGWGRC